MTDKLPSYFQKYLDDKFAAVDQRFNDMDERFDVLEKKVSGSQSKINLLWVAVLIIGIVLLVHFGESSGGILKLLFGRI